jgi:hypothetical protein
MIAHELPSTRRIGIIVPTRSGVTYRPERPWQNQVKDAEPLSLQGCLEGAYLPLTDEKFKIENDPLEAVLEPGILVPYDSNLVETFLAANPRLPFKPSTQREIPMGLGWIPVMSLLDPGNPAYANLYEEFVIFTYESCT